MDCGLSVFLLDFRDVGIFGARRRHRLPRDVLEVLANYDEQADVEDDGLISHGDALREIFAGSLSRPDDCASIYGWAYELYCSSLGEWLSNSYFCPCTVEWFKTLDAVLAQHDVPLSFDNLLFKAFPIPIDPGDLCGGLWTHDEMLAARPALARAFAAAEPGGVAEALRLVVGWLDEAAKRPASAIVAFYG